MALIQSQQVILNMVGQELSCMAWHYKSHERVMDLLDRAVGEEILIRREVSWEQRQTQIGFTVILDSDDNEHSMEDIFLLPLAEYFHCNVYRRVATGQLIFVGMEYDVKMIEMIYPALVKAIHARIKYIQTEEYGWDTFPAEEQQRKNESNTNAMYAWIARKIYGFEVEFHVAHAVDVID